MNASERFYRTLDKMNGRGEGLAVTVEAVRAAFTQAVGTVPHSLSEAIFLRFLDAFNRSGKPEEAFAETAYSLGPYIDLFWMDYAEEGRPLEKADWVFLRDEVSAAAGDLDLDILTYIMRQILEHGAI
ncbi:MAG: hypothetical protein LBT68_05025 [Spirochaetales bacterium]|jgi:hypothetical protein|nr:hypothetical protein [Spirochaetales bacterium]